VHSCALRIVIAKIPFINKMLGIFLAKGQYRARRADGILNQA